jgi:hypothetical protein
MNQQQVNLQFFVMLNEWDPFRCGEGNYDPEIADTIQAVHDLDDVGALAKRIQQIYEFSFEELIPDESCLQMAHKLLQTKTQGSCSL